MLVPQLTWTCYKSPLGGARRREGFTPGRTRLYTKGKRGSGDESEIQEWLVGTGGRVQLEGDERVGTGGYVQRGSGDWPCASLGRREVAGTGYVHWGNKICQRKVRLMVKMEANCGCVRMPLLSRAMFAVMSQGLRTHVLCWVTHSLAMLSNLNCILDIVMSTWVELQHLLPSFFSSPFITFSCSPHFQGNSNDRLS